MKPLSVTDVRKTFTPANRPPILAVDGISMEIEPGAIHGLLGPNGAGKSTLINMISGVMLPSQGALSVFGIDVMKEPERAKQLMGVVPQEIVMEMAFTVEEVLYYFGGMYGVPMSQRQAVIDQVLTDLDLIDKKKEKARSLSGGMKRRLMVAKAIMHKPKFLILDEPTAGVDVALRQKIWELVRRLNKEEGTTILFTTHYLEEAEELCDRITVVDHGRVIKEGRVEELQREFSQNMITFELFRKDVPHLEEARQSGTVFVYNVHDLPADLKRISDHYGSNLKSIRNETASLEHIFLELTKK